LEVETICFPVVQYCVKLTLKKV